MTPAPAIVVDRQVQAHRVSRPVLQQVADHDQVPQRLAHLRPGVLDHGRVQPAPGERRLSGDRLGLGDLAFVMGEDEVGASAVEVERRSEEAGAHHRALDVPTRAAGTPRALPRGLARGLSLPEDEVEGIPLVRIVGPVPALVGHRQHLRSGQVAQPAESGPGGDMVVDSAARDVGETSVDQHADRHHDVRDDVGGARIGIRRTDVQALHVADEVGGPAVAQRAPVLPELGGLAQNVIVDVGDILNVAHRPALALQGADEYVGNGVGEGVAQMRGVVRRDAAHVERDRVARRRERLDGLDHGVVEVHARHSSPSHEVLSRAAPRGRADRS